MMKLLLLITLLLGALASALVEPANDEPPMISTTDDVVAVTAKDFEFIDISSQEISSFKVLLRRVLDLEKDLDSTKETVADLTRSLGYAHGNITALEDKLAEVSEVGACGVEGEVVSGFTKDSAGKFALQCRNGKIDFTVVQKKILGTCDGATAVTGVDVDGNVQCSEDVIMEADRNNFQVPLKQQCSSGKYLREIAADGTVTCEDDEDTTYAAGIDYQMPLKRECADGKVLVGFEADGTPTCVDDINTVYDVSVFVEKFTDVCEPPLVMAGITSDSKPVCRNQGCDSGNYFDAASSTCKACPVGAYAAVPGADECTSCPAGATTASTGSASQLDCICDKGYEGDARFGTCTKCEPTTYKEATGNTECTRCADTHTSHVVGSITSGDCMEFQWTAISGVGDLEATRAQYPSTHYEIAINYNSDVRIAYLTTWQGQMPRASTYPWYPQLDNADGFHFGTAVFIKGDGGATRGATLNPNTFYHRYYRLNAEGSPVSTGGNGAANSVQSYIRPLMHPWVEVGQLKDFDTLRQQYPDTHYEWGMAVDGDIRTAFANHWSNGVRITLHPMVSMGTDGGAFKWGTAVFSKGLGGTGGSVWEKSYYQYPDVYFAAGGSGDSQVVYVRKMEHPWEPAGSLGAYDSLRSEYPDTTHEFGIRFRGDIQYTFMNGWNRGNRLTLYPFFPSGSAYNSLNWGTTVFHRAVSFDANPDRNWQHEDYNIDKTGISDVSDGSLGYMNYMQIYVKKRQFPWEYVGTMADYFNLYTAYPPTKFDLGFSYNGDIQMCRRNTWNRGYRVTVYPIYPTGDSVKSFNFGTSMLLRNTDSSRLIANIPTDLDNWYHRYYQYPSSNLGGNSGSKNTKAVYARRKYHNIYHSAFGV